MSAPVLPKTLFVYLLSDGFGPRFSVHETRDDADGHRPQGQLGDCSPVTEYVDVAELTRLRATLAEIAALQTEEPTARPNTDAGFFEAFDAGEAHGVKVGHFEAGNIARGAMKHSSSEEAK